MGTVSQYLWCGDLIDQIVTGDETCPDGAILPLHGGERLRLVVALVPLLALNVVLIPLFALFPPFDDWIARGNVYALLECAPRRPRARTAASSPAVPDRDKWPYYLEGMRLKLSALLLVRTPCFLCYANMALRFLMAVILTGMHEPRMIDADARFARLPQQQPEWSTGGESLASAGPLEYARRSAGWCAAQVGAAWARATRVPTS